jgi:hypothetical protein
MSLSGAWEGKLLDVSGPTAAISLRLRERGGALTGEFEAAFLSLGEDGCCAPSRRTAQVGPVSGAVDRAKGVVRLDYQLSVGNTPVAVTFEGVVRKADPYAVRALVGCYRVGKGGERLTLQGGACVLWLFAQAAVAGRARSKEA